MAGKSGQRAMPGERTEFTEISEFLTAYFTLDEIPRVEDYILNEPGREERFPGPRNEKGYRSGSFEDRGDFNIAFLGDGWVEGSGVAQRDIFTTKVQSKLEIWSGLTVRSWNLGLADVGMDHVVRLAPAVCNALSPELIVVVVPPTDRFEHFANGGRRISVHKTPMGVGSTAAECDTAEYSDLLAAYDELTSEYHELFTVVQCFNSMQGIFDAAGIPWVYSWIDDPGLSERIEKMRQIGSVPDHRYVGAPFTRVDCADTLYECPGRKSHEVFSNVVVDWVRQSNLMQSKRTERISALRHWAGKALIGRLDVKDPTPAADSDEESLYPLW
jgi:hypothetical protein